ncbi:hypothetical protein HU200_060348 [Digitaria exilis]|uniref:Glycosyltransferase 61 catalytic domain-containing protein n=1 Tax=Digitaria exilis TaxID=1010633 RepID=A0A835A6J9_9POAL|nr:hypothetical protein HU200_060348 [Digitaria exilis]
MKGGGDKAGRGGLRLESPRFRLLSIVVGCFVFCLVFLLSSRPDVTSSFDIVSPRASLANARRPAAVKTLRTSSATGAGEGTFACSVNSPPITTAKCTKHAVIFSFVVRDTVIVEERSDAEAIEAEHEEAERENDGNAATAASNSDDQPAPAEEKTQAAVATGQSKLQEQPARQQPQEDLHEPAQSGGGDHQQQQQPLCDFSDFRSDICDLAGDIRLDANASSFIVVDPATSGADVATTHKVRPYPRKGDMTCMNRITEITVRRATTTGDAPPRCTVTHTSPAVVFSIGGYTGNIFHDFSDVLVPLYNTAHRYAGDVQLVMANAASWWLVKYAKLLRELSRHPPLDLAKAAASGEVHCFSHAVVSLSAHKELIIEKDRSVDGNLSTTDFTRFVRRALSLPRDSPTRLGDATGKRPRLLVISRHRTRLLLNLDAVIRAAEEVGFEAVVNESDVGNDISEVGKLINSCDAMVGVHGAGLTNMMFLPPGATLVQIVPWGGLQWMARADYGDPAEAMGLKYVQYEVGVGESTLKDKFPAGHKIFTEPTSLHKKGFAFIRQVLMDGQDIVVDVGRFREVLLQVLNNLSQ